MFNVQSEQFGRKTDYSIFFKNIEKSTQIPRIHFIPPSPQVSGDGFWTNLGDHRMLGLPLPAFVRVPTLKLDNQEKICYQRVGISFLGYHDCIQWTNGTTLVYHLLYNLFQETKDVWSLPSTPSLGLSLPTILRDHVQWLRSHAQAWKLLGAGGLEECCKWK